MNKKLTPRQFIPLEQIDHEDETLQTRSYGTLRAYQQTRAEDETEKHINRLVKELELRIKQNSQSNPEKAHLDEIVVFYSDINHRYIVVSGFHRLQAYLRFNEKQTSKKKLKKSIPARQFIGTLSEARLYSHSQNTKPELAKTEDSIQNSAWVIIFEDDKSLEGLTLEDKADLLHISPHQYRRMVTARNKVNNGEWKFYDNWKDQRKCFQKPDWELEDIKQVDDMTERYTGKIMNEIHDQGFNRDTSKTLECIQRVLEELGKTPDDLKTGALETEDDDF